MREAQGSICSSTFFFELEFSDIGVSVRNRQAQGSKHIFLHEYSEVVYMVSIPACHAGNARPWSFF